MNKKMTIAMIGGTGKSGKYILQKLVDTNLNVRAMVRNPMRVSVQSPNLEIITGDMKDRLDVENLLKNCDAVISALGFGIPPDEPTLFSKATQNVLDVMDRLKIRRYILLSGLHVDVPSDRKSDKTRFATAWMYENFPSSTRDRQHEYDLLVNSNCDWTLIRLPMIEQTSELKEVIVDLKDCPSDGISSTSLANFVIRQIDDESFIRKAPFIGNR
jgi:putative NADH-flavin reductase